MKKLATFFVLLCLLIATSCSGQKKEGCSKEIVLETTHGDIRIALFDATPGHRDNIIQNVKDGKYEGVTFHRVIRSFMIQTGDPDTRIGEVKDTTKAPERIASEFRFPQLYHKRGMVGAARDDADKNPELKSDKYQFYIVTGKTCTDTDVLNYESARAERTVQEIFNKLCDEHKKEIDAVRALRDPYKLSDKLEEYMDMAKSQVEDNPPLTFTKEQRRDYRSVGGAPWLDGEYTIFGEVVEGMKAVEAIQKVKTDKNDVPEVEIRINHAYVVE